MSSPKDKDAKSHEDDDDSYDAEDEVPLSKLVTKDDEAATPKTEEETVKLPADDTATSPQAGDKNEDDDKSTPQHPPDADADDNKDSKADDTADAASASPESLSPPKKTPATEVKPAASADPAADDEESEDKAKPPAESGDAPKEEATAKDESTGSSEKKDSDNGPTKADGDGVLQKEATGPDVEESNPELDAASSPTEDTKANETQDSPAKKEPAKEVPATETPTAAKSETEETPESTSESMEIHDAAKSGPDDSAADGGSETKKDTTIAPTTPVEKPKETVDVDMIDVAAASPDVVPVRALGPSLAFQAKLALLQAEMTLAAGDETESAPTTIKPDVPSTTTTTAGPSTAAAAAVGQPCNTKPSTSALPMISDNSLRRERPKVDASEGTIGDAATEGPETDDPPTKQVSSLSDIPAGGDQVVAESEGGDATTAMDVDEETTNARSEKMEIDDSTKQPAESGGDAIAAQGGTGAAAAADSKPEPSPPRKPPVPPPAWAVEVESEDEEGVDPFEAFKTSTVGKVVRPKRTILKRLNVSISSLPAGSVKEDEKKEDDDGFNPKPLSAFQRDIFPLSIEEQVARAEAELEDSLKFFRESHEDQDPSFALYEKNQKKKQVEAELRRLEAEDEAGRKEIEAIVAEQLKDKQATTDRSVEKYKAKKMADEKKDMAKLQKIFSDKVASNQTKINQGIQVLEKRHALETQRILQQHRQQVQQRQVPPEIASQEWANLQQRLRTKHERQIQEFAGKGEEVKKRTEAEFQRERTKIRKQYEKQLHDVENNRRGIYSKMYAGFQQLRQRYLKRHIQKMLKKKEALKMTLLESESPKAEINEEKGQPSQDTEKSSQDDKVALRPPSPIKTGGEAFNALPHDKSGAAARHKHRKGMLSQISKQLSVEIHNEGIWIAILQEKKDEKRKDPTKDPHTDSEKKLFMPWGIQSRDFLESIVCGEVPSTLESKDFDFGDAVAMNGGHVRCVLTDLRTSDETAVAQRTEAIHEQAHAEVAALEKKAADLQAAFTNAEKMHARYDKEEKDLLPKAKEAIKDYENKKISWQNFRTKFSKFMGPDGNPLPQTNPSDRQKLIAATTKYKGAVEAAEKRAKLAQMKMAEAKQQTQKYFTLAKQTQRAAAVAAAAWKKKQASPGSDIDRSSSRVNDMIAALELTADKRRDQLNQKRNSSTSSTWVQNLPGVPGPLRRSLWHKMHRRRQQIVLRPSQETLAADLKTAVVESLSKTENYKNMSAAAKTAELQKAEQAFLLATHPIAPRDEEILSVPSNSSWGEPGWHLVLDVPKDKGNNILPRAFGAALVERNLSEIHSAPGRQAAALIRTSQLRSLAAPLSAISTATSLAETNPAVAISPRSRPIENDPLHPTEVQLGMAYTFNPKVLQHKPPPPVRRKSSKDQPTAASTATKVPPKKPTPSTASQAAATVLAQAAEASAAAAKAAARKRKAAAEAAAKPAQRRKPSSKPTAAQAKAIQLQQQQQQQQQQKKLQQQKQQQVQQQQQQRQQQLQQQKQQQLQQQQQMQQQQRQQQQMQQQQIQQQQHQPPPPQPQQTSHAQYNRQLSMGGMDSSQNSYSQYMQPMGTPPSQPPPQRTSYQQQLYQQQQQQQVQQRQPPPPQQQQQFQPQQMAQLRMMQQQHHQPQPPPQYGQSPHGMQPMPQFFQPMQQQFAPQPMPMPVQVVGPSGMPMNLQGNSAMRQNPPSGDDQNDPLFMLKDM